MADDRTKKVTVDEPSVDPRKSGTDKAIARNEEKQGPAKASEDALAAPKPDAPKSDQPAKSAADKAIEANDGQALMDMQSEKNQKSIREADEAAKASPETVRPTSGIVQSEKPALVHAGDDQSQSVGNMAESQPAQKEGIQHVKKVGGEPEAERHVGPNNKDGK